MPRYRNMLADGTASLEVARYSSIASGSRIPGYRNIPKTNFCIEFARHSRFYFWLCTPFYRNTLTLHTMVRFAVARHSRCEPSLPSVDPRRDFGTMVYLYGRRLSSQDTRHPPRAVPTGISQNNT
ncbi:hypothetical protein NP493_1787g00004 [Ridgeia piscesae]|uniref:Uncharacterized protein n=1 Tax=Ridgeia piscesae TaxID=27915 RepID=A0AAD9JU63_RIDPI|nr:hypothetical protein NP493_1787g00004 [Ridgeia piscesae]